MRRYIIKIGQVTRLIPLLIRNRIHQYLCFTFTIYNFTSMYSLITLTRINSTIHSSLLRVCKKKEEYEFHKSLSLYKYMDAHYACNVNFNMEGNGAYCPSADCTLSSSMSADLEQINNGRLSCVMLSLFSSCDEPLSDL